MIDTQAIRRKILDLALRGSLTEQLPEDGTAKELFQSIQIKRQEFDTKNKKTSQMSEILIEELEHKIPDNWMWVRLETIAKVDGGNTPNTQEISEIGEIPYFKVSDMNVSGNEKEMHIASFFVNEKYKGKIFPAGTIIFPKNGGAALTNKRRILVADSVIDLNTAGCYPYIKDILGWMDLFFSTIDFGQFNTGTTIPTVSVGLIKNLIMPLPPYAEQQRIVKCVEEIFSLLAIIDKYQSQYRNNQISLKSKLIDAAIRGKLTEQLPEDGTAEELFQQIQQEKKELEQEGKIKKSKAALPISNGEGPFEIPHNWKWVKLGDVCKKITDGTHHSPPNFDRGEYMYVTAKNIKESGVAIDKITYVTKEIHDEIISRCNPEKDDVLLIKDGATAGIVTVNNMDESFSMLSSVALIKPTMGILPWFIVYVLRSSWFSNYIRSEMTGVGITRIVLKQIESFLIPLPPLEEQKRIVAKLKELLEVCGG